MASAVNCKYLRTVERLSRSKRVLRGGFLFSTLPPSDRIGLERFPFFDYQYYLTFMIPRFLDIIQALHFHTLMATDKDVGTPRVFLARHGLPSLKPTAIPQANTLYRSDRVEHEREVNNFSCLCANSTRSGDKL